MELRPVDERDARWEQSELDFRVCIDDQGRRETYDVDGARFEEVAAWAKGRSGAGVTYSVAVRTVNDADGLGLLWLVVDAAQGGGAAAPAPRSDG